MFHPRSTLPRPVEAASLAAPLNPAHRLRNLRARHPRGGAAWRCGSLPAACSRVTAPQARPPRSRRASFCGRRQVGPTGREAACSARRHSAKRRCPTFGRIRKLHAHADQARRRWQGCAPGKHGLAGARWAFRTCAAGCESPCLRRYVGPARACAPPMRTPQPGGPGSSILGPAGRWPPGCRFGLSFIGLPGLFSRQVCCPFSRPRAASRTLPATLLSSSC